MTMTLADYVALQSYGAQIVDQGGVRRGGAGPADAAAYVIGGHPVMIPALSATARASDYAFVPDGDGWRIERQGRPLCRARAVPTPRFYAGRTAAGIPYAKIARLHGQDCLASTVIQECARYNSRRTRCRFCAIGASLDQDATIHTKTPEQLAEVARAAQALDGVTHVTLTAGTTPCPDDGALSLGRCAEAIATATGLPVEIQFEPLRDPGLYARLRGMGVTDVGIHVESFDPAVRRRMTPGKAVIGLEAYFEAFAAAVAVFGRNKVSTYVILGLGEDEALTLDGCRRAAALGVYPVVVPLRPLLDSCLAEANPVDPAYLGRMYRRIGTLLRQAGLSAEASTAGCVRCRACSLLQFTESAPGRTPAQPAAPGAVADAAAVTLRVAASPDEFEEYLRLRHEVFVSEQGLFSDSDRDAHDATAIPIIALVGGKVAGVVRCYRHRGGVWYGGRLAVRAEFRGGVNIGALLVRKAVALMRARPDVRRFLATVQFQNVRFFERIGWVKLGKPFFLQGRKHQVMENKLREEAP
ncbi:MAG: MSMEG_0568 family radical SAM protein [Solidesulfovibrio sp. DCME]|uniref:MSMEG_0568 family radical SAM protein n=1 Tax=Solidesulfovibrio sp. DCME TaxID=3447380 RepID=UPI003D12F0ED